MPRYYVKIITEHPSAIETRLQEWLDGQDPDETIMISAIEQSVYMVPDLPNDPRPVVLITIVYWISEEGKRWG